jgi:hypothetical protein
MIHSSVPVENGHAFLFRSFTVAPIHAVIRPVVPLAWEGVQRLCKHRNTPLHQISSQCLKAYHSVYCDTSIEKINKLISTKDSI